MAKFKVVTDNGETIWKWDVEDGTIDTNGNCRFYIIDIRRLVDQNGSRDPIRVRVPVDSTVIIEYLDK